MKCFEVILCLCLWLEIAIAHPHAAQQLDNTKRQTGVVTDPGFNAKKQYVSNTGIHKFVPPDFAAGDVRGPCPGLNAMANHGYIDHSGIDTLENFADATVEVYGMGADVGQAFSAYATFVAGDGLSWSLGGPFNSTVPNLLAQPGGISNSHNRYEGDSSAARNDLYEFGNDYETNIHFYKQLYDALGEKGADSIATLGSHRSRRVQQSISGNPYYFNGPFTGLLIASGANSFVFRLMANKSKEYPEGLLTRSVLNTFYGVTESPSGKLTKHDGFERIPDNWYKRPLDDPYTVPYAAYDIANYIKENHNVGLVGGNTGKVNTFTGVDLANLTGGVYNAETLAHGNNAACFAFQAGSFLAPDILAEGFKDISAGVSAINKAFDRAIAPLHCPKLEKLDKAQFNQYPGYSKDYSYYKGQ